MMINAYQIRHPVIQTQGCQSVKTQKSFKTVETSWQWEIKRVVTRETK